MLTQMGRRQFLERSVLGASSFLFSATLLARCTDHNFPDPVLPINSPIFPPELGLSIDWNDDAKATVTSVIEMIPEAGDILGGLVDILWPSSQEDVWGEIKAQVETIVNLKIAAAVYQQVSEDLQGLNNALTLYLNELKNGTATEILNQWMITRSLFVTALPHFQSPGNQLPLLGLFGQFANLYLGLLRDAVQFGQSWGRTDADHQQDITDLKNSINGFYAYTAQTYNTGRANLAATIARNDDRCEWFRSINSYDRQMTFTVLDFMFSWHYYDITVYQSTPANPIKVKIAREVYTDPWGSCSDSGVIGITTPIPTQFPTQLTVWGYDRIDAVQLTYPAGSGPGGVTTTPRMGDQLDPKNPSFGGSNQPPYGGIFNITPDNLIIAGRVIYSNFLYNGYVSAPLVAQLQFMYADGTQTNLTGGTAGSTNYTGDTGWLGYPYEALSSIHINGVNKILKTADSIVLGFQYWKSPAAQLNTIQTIYVKSPKERSAADFAKSFPKLTVPANLITDELKAARKAYWAALEARAKKLK